MTRFEPRARILAPPAALVILLLWFQWHATQARNAMSVTVDETVYLVCATNTVAVQSYDPILAQLGVAPIPILFPWLPVLDADTASRNDYWSGGHDDPLIVDRARWLVASVIGSLLISGVYLWLLVRQSLFWAVVGSSIIAASPTFIAHCSLATTDALTALSWLFCTAVYSICFRDITPQRCAIAGAACGLTLSVTYSSLALVLTFVTILTSEFARGCRGNRMSTERRMLALRLASCLLSFLTTTAMVTWMFHGFEFSQLGCGAFGAVPWLGQWVDTLPSPVVGILQQHLHNQHGQLAMLGGDVERYGWWYYFPATFLLKSTLTELSIALLLGIMAYARMDVLLRVRQRSMGAMSSSGDGPAGDFWGVRALGNSARMAQNSEDTSPLIWLCTVAISSAMLLAVQVQIGHRYLIPLLPIALILTVDLLASWINQRCPQRHRIGLLGALFLFVGAQFWSSIASSPNYLSYGSPVVGGGPHLFRWLADSNVDWGQDLPALKRVLEATAPNRRVILSYFGTALPEAYGISVDLLPSHSNRSLAKYDLLAISVNHLHGIYLGKQSVDHRFRPLLECDPVARAGDSIMLYEISKLPEAVREPER